MRLRLLRLAEGGLRMVDLIYKDQLHFNFEDQRIKDAEKRYKMASSIEAIFMLRRFSQARKLSLHTKAVFLLKLRRS